MKITSVKMKGQSIAIILPALFIMLLLGACNKSNDHHFQANSSANHPNSYSSEVIEKWMALQVRLMKNTTGVPNQAFSRHYVYSGIAALESIAPGFPAYGVWTKKWNGLTGLPHVNPSTQFYWPANVNAALARMNRAFFPNASLVDKAAIDSLENVLHNEYLTGNDGSLITASEQFGKDVATAVLNWAATDGYLNANNPYTPPVGPGLWVPTAPAFAPAASPYWGNNRTVITGSIANTQPAAPIAYSTVPNSPFHNMVKSVYDASLNLTTEQKAMAAFWRDVPGVTSPGHWLSIVKQVIEQTDSPLGKAALAYAITGAAINDGLISCWKTKYQYNLVRPITYIRDVMGHSTWTPYLTTPGHPEYTSAHAVLSVAAGEVVKEIFGDVDSFTDHTYDYLGYAPRTYSSYEAIGLEAAHSRFFAGIHYPPSIQAGIVQGKKVAENILNLNPAHTRAK